VNFVLINGDGRIDEFIEHLRTAAKLTKRVIETRL
jgi:hypothetical protein